MIKGKIKVAMVCSFSNAKVREHLPLSNRKFYKFTRKLMGLPVSSENIYGDVAGWDTYMIELLRKRDDIDLTVISAHDGLKRRKCSFELEGVHYHFIRSEIATMLKHIIHSPALWHQLNPMRPIVRRIIKQTKPDVIALIGAENPHISGTVLGIKDIPLIVKCQTIYNNPDRGKTGPVDNKNAYVERLIFEDLQYVSVTTEMHERLFRTMNQKAINFKWNLGNLLPAVKALKKEYDFVNYAMCMSDNKGFSDAIKALVVVKKQYPDVKMNLIGRASKEIKDGLVALLTSLGLSENVVFTTFFEKQEDLFQHLQKSRYALLPCKLDFIASTVRQAMHYELPVVCYATEGTITLNKEKECVLIAKNSDVDDLASQMLMLLDNPQKADLLRQNAKEYSIRWSNDAENSQQMVDNFKAVIENYRNGTPVPEKLLLVV